jgi:hypothetical protein
VFLLREFFYKNNLHKYFVGWQFKNDEDIFSYLYNKTFPNGPDGKDYHTNGKYKIMINEPVSNKED